jgi:hypothetical protein
MLLGKFVLIENLTNKSDYVPYVKSGAAIGAYEEKNLVPAIKSILYDKRTQEKLRKKMKKFIEWQVKSGNATTRTVKFIEELQRTKKAG